MVRQTHEPTSIDTAPAPAGAARAGDVPDRVLVARVRRGDPDAFGDLVERYSTMVTGLCRRFMADHHDALDVAQDAFL